MDEPAITVRRAGADDAAAVEALYRDLTSHPDVRVIPGQIVAMSQSDRSFLLVAEAKGKVLGTVLLSICLDAMYSRQPFGVIENIVVTESVRGKGIGRALLAEVEKLARAEDCSKLMLFSSVARPRAHEFFRKRGFADDRKLGFVKYRREFS